MCSASTDGSALRVNRALKALRSRAPVLVRLSCAKGRQRRLALVLPAPRHGVVGVVRRLGVPGAQLALPLPAPREDAPVTLRRAPRGGRGVPGVPVSYAAAGGLFSRCGLAEAAIDLCWLGGLPSAALVMSARLPHEARVTHRRSPVAVSTIDIQRARMRRFGLVY